MGLSTMHRRPLAGFLIPAELWSVPTRAQTPVTTIVNASFETGTPGQPVGAGWATAPGYGPMFVVDSSIVPLLEGIDPVAPSHGQQFISGNRNAGGCPTNQPMGVFQDVDLTPYSGEIGLGDRRMEFLLYRGYVGRVNVSGGMPVDVFINDWSTTNNANRTWYDGVGYALVSPIEMGLAGDYNNDGRVDAGDYVRWRNHLGDEDESAIFNNGDGGGVGLSDYAWWKQHYGNSDGGSGGLGQPAVPEPAGTCIAIAGLAWLSLKRGRRTSAALGNNQGWRQR